SARRLGPTSRGRRSLCLVGVTAAGRDRVGAAATSHSRRRGANFFHYRPNGARRGPPLPTSLQVSRRRRAAARLCWVALANRRECAPSARERVGDTTGRPIGQQRTPCTVRNTVLTRRLLVLPDQSLRCASSRPRDPCSPAAAFAKL